MNTIQKRILIFLFGCITSRLAIVWYVKNCRSCQLVKLLLIMISFGFGVIYLFDLRKTGLEVFGAKIWWNSLRPIHALLYGLAGYYLGKNNDYAWKILLIDTMIGLVAFLNHHGLLK
jgi:hypothetical protein